MIKAEFEKEKLKQYIFLLHDIVFTSIAVFDARLSPIIDTDDPKTPDTRVENIREKLSDGKTAPALWFAPDGTAQVAVPILYRKKVYAYAWMGNLYYESVANPHMKEQRDGHPIYDNRSIRNILGLIEGGVELFVRDFNEIDPELQNKVDRYISENLNQKITLRSLSTALHTNITALRTFFIEELQCNLSEYLRRQRIEAAKQLLAETNLSFAEISAKIGLPEEKFNQIFRKSVSVSPDEYRKNSRK